MYKIFYIVVYMYIYFSVFVIVTAKHYITLFKGIL